MVPALIASSPGPSSLLVPRPGLSPGRRGLAWGRGYCPNLVTASYSRDLGMGLDSEKSFKPTLILQGNQFSWWAVRFISCLYVCCRWLFSWYGEGVLWLKHCWAAMQVRFVACTCEECSYGNLSLVLRYGGQEYPCVQAPQRRGAGNKAKQVKRRLFNWSSPLSSPFPPCSPYSLLPSPSPLPPLFPISPPFLPAFFSFLLPSSSYQIPGPSVTSSQVLWWNDVHVSCNKIDSLIDYLN